MARAYILVPEEVMGRSAVSPPIFIIFSGEAAPMYRFWDLDVKERSFVHTGTDASEANDCSARLAQGEFAEGLQPMLTSPASSTPVGVRWDQAMSMQVGRFTIVSVMRFTGTRKQDQRAFRTKKKGTLSTNVPTATHPGEFEDAWRCVFFNSSWA